MVTTQLVRLLNDAVGGRIAPDAVAAILGFTAIQYLPTLLSLTLFAAILTVLSHQYRDSEMVIWLASGFSLFSFSRPILRFALPVILLVAALSIAISPWAWRKSGEFRERMNQRSEATLLSPGVFREMSGSDRVVFVEHVDENSGEVAGVFVRANEKGKLVLVSAEKGRKQLAANGDQFLVLNAGRRYEMIPGSPELNVVEFERYSVRLEQKEKLQPPTAMYQLSSNELLRRNGLSEQAELMWRISVPIAALVLALLAIPLAYVNPRGGKSFGVIVALLVFLTYNNMLSVFQSWVAQGRLSVFIAVWLPHAMLLGLYFLMTWRRISVRKLWRR